MASLTCLLNSLACECKNFVQLLCIERVKYTFMTTIQFIEIKPFTSCCKDLEVSYHIPSSIPSSSRHYIALCEAGESSQFTWVWAGKTVSLQQEGITVKWREGKVTFASQVLPKLSDGREYYLMYCNEDGTILGESRPFQFFTDSDEFSSIDLQSAPSDDVVMVSMHRKKAPPTTSSEVSLHSDNNDDDTTSFEVLPEQRYTDTTEPLAGDKEPEYFSQSVTATVIPKGDNNTKQSTASKLSLEGSDTKTDDDLLTSSYKERNYQNVPMESGTNEEVLQATLKDENIRLKDELTTKDSLIEDLQAEITMLKEQIALNTLSNSTVLINSPKEDKEKRILKKRIQEETKKSARFEELLVHKETHILQLQNEKAELLAEVEKVKQRFSQDVNTLQIKYQELLDQTEKLQSTPFATEQQNVGSSVKLATNSKLTKDDIANYNIPVGGDYKTKLYLKLFRQDPFICHKCNEILPAHTQEFTRLNHIQQCQGVL